MVVITGLDKVAPAVRAIQSGAAEYLVKPVAAEVLQHAVNRALATQGLLRENAALRRHVSLLETGQRISTTLDRHRLATTTCAAFLGLASASAVMLLHLDAEGRPRLLGTQQLTSAEQEAELLTRLVPAVRGVAVEPRLLDGTAGRPGTTPSPCPRSMARSCSATPCSSTPARRPRALAEATGFLARRLALALRNLGRFAAGGGPGVPGRPDPASSTRATCSWCWTAR